jgi:LmbE family N-acetylglucosaminyl deacetylase
MPTLENRKKVARLIRNWQADIVLSHRPYDYHADHRGVGQLIEDAAVLVVAPFFVPDSSPLKQNPVFLYYSDGFKKPYPFEPTVVVGIDEVAEKKWACVAAMPSQFGDKDSWQARTLPNVPIEEEQRKEHLLQLVRKRNSDVADQYRSRLIELYGETRGRRIKYAEAFELCQYGTQRSVEELKQLFSMFP